MSNRALSTSGQIAIAIIVAAAASSAFAAAFSLVHEFTPADGIIPNGVLIQATDSQYYGCTGGNQASTWGTAFSMDELGDLSVMHTFTRSGPEGYRCNGFVQASDGLFYGTSNAGGVGTSCGFFDEACGTVFRMDAAGSITVLHTFVGSDGSRPACERHHQGPQKDG